MENNNEEDDTLFSQTPLLWGLRKDSVEILAQVLQPNSQKSLLETPSGRIRDLRGLANFSGLSISETNHLLSEPNATEKIILHWCRNIYNNFGVKATVQDFFDCITNKLDRRDLFVDTNIRGRFGMLTELFFTIAAIK